MSDVLSPRVKCYISVGVTLNPGLSDGFGPYDEVQDNVGETSFLCKESPN